MLVRVEKDTKDKVVKKLPVNFGHWPSCQSLIGSLPVHLSPQAVRTWLTLSRTSSSVSQRHPDIPPLVEQFLSEKFWKLYLKVFFFFLRASCSVFSSSASVQHVKFSGSFKFPSRVLESKFSIEQFTLTPVLSGSCRHSCRRTDVFNWCLMSSFCLFRGCCKTINIFLLFPAAHNGKLLYKVHTVLMAPTTGNVCRFCRVGFSCSI